VALDTRYLTLPAVVLIAEQPPVSRTISPVSGTWANIAANLSYQDPLGTNRNVNNYYKIDQAKSGHIASAVYYTYANGALETSVLNVRSWDITANAFAGSITDGFKSSDTSIYSWVKWSDNSQYLNVIEWNGALTASNVQVYERTDNTLTYKTSVNLDWLIYSSGWTPTGDRLFLGNVVYDFNGTTLSSAGNVFVDRNGNTITNSIPIFNRWGNLAMAGSSGPSGQYFVYNTATTPYRQRNINNLPASAYTLVLADGSQLSISQAGGAPSSPYAWSGETNDIIKFIGLDGSHLDANISWQGQAVVHSYVSGGTYGNGIQIAQDTISIATRFPTLSAANITVTNDPVRPLNERFYVYARGGYNDMIVDKNGNNVYLVNNRPTYRENYSSNANAYITVWNRDSNFALESNISLGTLSTGNDYNVFSGDNATVFEYKVQQGEFSSYIDGAYAEQDYFVDGLVAASAGITIDGRIFQRAGASITSVSSLEVAGRRRAFNADEEYVDAGYYLDGYTAFEPKGTANIASAFTANIVGTVLPGALLDLQSAFAITIEGGVVTLGSADFATAFDTTISAAKIRDAQTTLDVVSTFDTSASRTRTSSTQIDTNATISIDGQRLKGGVATLDAVATQTTTGSRTTPATVNLLSEGFATLTGAATRDKGADLVAQFSITASPNKIAGAQSTVDSAFSITAIGTVPVIKRGELDLVSTFTQDTSVKKTAGAFATPQTNFQTTIIGGKRVSASATFDVLDFVLVTSRVIHLPFALQFQVLYEERMFNVPSDTRTLDVPFEDRVNMVSQEQRSLDVAAEDRELDASL
jgi:hypothetical protein